MDNFNIPVGIVCIYFGFRSSKYIIKNIRHKTIRIKLLYSVELLLSFYMFLIGIFAVLCGLSGDIASFLDPILKILLKPYESIKKGVNKL